MAVFIVAVASSMALVVLSGSARSALTTKQGDQGLAVASAALESAAVFDCGTTTAMLASGAGDLSTPTNPVAGSLTTRYQRCVPAGKAAVGDLGDVRWREVDGPLAFDVTLRTNWVLFSPRADVDNTDPEASGTHVAKQYYRLRRDVTVAWTIGGRTRRRTLAQLAAPPPDVIARSNRASLTVTDVPAGADGPGHATLALGGGFTVTHSADGRGVVRFPFLEPGVTYPLSVNGTTRAAVTPSDGIPDVVRAA